MRQLFEALFSGLQKPTPVFGFDSTSSPAMSSVTTYHSTTRRLASGRAKVCLEPTHRLLSASHPRIADPKRLFKRQHRLWDTLCTPSTVMGLIRLLDDERELLM
jgi:hypothetical protein